MTRASAARVCRSTLRCAVALQGAFWRAIFVAAIDLGPSCAVRCA